MSESPLDIVIVGLSVTSSWGNGHATTYRSLIRGLSELRHRVLFLERDVPWYADNRDLTESPHARIQLYGSIEELRRRFGDDVRRADLVIVGSFVPEGPAVCRWVLDAARGARAYYDIDTPVTLAMLARGDYRHFMPSLIPEFDLYLSFTGGPTLRELETRYGAQRARPLYCAVDETLYYPEPARSRWDLAYLGTYGEDRQPALERLLIQPALACPDRRFAVAGSSYPSTISWPLNVERIDHIPPAEHRTFYNSQKFTLNVTRGDMVRAGYSPSVRLFEAAACGTPIISDSWPGLEEFFTLGQEILIAESAADVLGYLNETSDERRLQLACAARQRVLAAHTSIHRAQELVNYAREPTPARSAC